MARRKTGGTNAPQEPATLPFTVAVDTREQRAYRFADLRADACDKYAPLVVPVIVTTLAEGDYSIAGMEKWVAVERKSMADLFNTIGQDRQRFERELHRLQSLRFAAIVVEADWGTIIHSPPVHSQLNPKIIFRSVIAWQQRFPNVHWWMLADRRFAEVATLRILERFWKGRQASRNSLPADEAEASCHA
jgi:hypothetical protein